MNTSALPRPPAWSRDRGLAAIAAAGTVVAIVYGTEVVPLRALGVVSWAGMTGLQAWAAVQARTIARLPAPPAVVRFWRFVGAAVALFGVGSAGALVTAVADGDAIHSPITTVHSVCLGVGALLLLVGMVSTPLGIPARRARVRFWLDAATVMVGVGLFAWQLGGLARRDAADAGTATQSLLPLIGPAALVVMAFGVVKIALGGTTPITRPAAALGVLAATLQSVNSAFEMAMVEAGHPTWRAGLAVITILLVAATVRVQLLLSRSTAARRRPPGRSYSRLPYIAVAATYGLLIWVLADTARVDVRAWSVLGGAIVSSALVVARQLAAFADNDDLLAQLNTNVRELAAAKEVLQQAVHERDALAGRLRHLAYHDELTGLANRALFLERLTETLAARRAGEAPTVVMIDLDDFKPVNDTYGHRAGDDLLRAVAGRLRGCVRDADLVARLGGDEFAIVLATPGPAEVAQLVRRIDAAVRRPVRVDAGVGVDAAEVRVRASIGTATANALAGPPGDVSTELTALLHHADLEMYADKQLGKPAAR